MQRDRAHHTDSGIFTFHVVSRNDVAAERDCAGYSAESGAPLSTLNSPGRPWPACPHPCDFQIPPDRYNVTALPPAPSPVSSRDRRLSGSRMAPLPDIPASRHREADQAGTNQEPAGQGPQPFNRNGCNGELPVSASAGSRETDFISGRRPLWPGRRSPQAAMAPRQLPALKAALTTSPSPTKPGGDTSTMRCRSSPPGPCPMSATG